MISNVTVGVSNESPLVITTSIIPSDILDETAMSKILNASANAYGDGVLRATKHLFEQYNTSGSTEVFLSFNAFELDNQGSKKNLLPLTSLFVNLASEELFVKAIKSLIRCLKNLEDADINTDQVDIMPKDIYLTSNFDVKLIVLPVLNAVPTNFPEFFAGLFARLPFTPQNSLFTIVSQYFAIHQQDYTFTELDSELNKLLGGESQSGIADSLETSIESGSNLPSDNQNTPNISVSTVPETVPETQAETSFENRAKVLPTLTDITSNESFKVTKFPFTIGRSRDFSDFVLNNPKISSVHCRIIKTDTGGIQIVDTNSTNHVRVNEVKIAPSIPEDLRTGDLIRLADVTFRIHF